MKIVKPRAAFKDTRGSITDILDGVPVECVTLLTFKRGAVRGNHYHKKTTQYAYLLEGKLRVFTQLPGRPVRSRVVSAGELIVTPPKERHAFEALKDTMILACAHGPRAGRSYEADTFRLSEPISGKLG